MAIQPMNVWVRVNEPHSGPYDLVPFEKRPHYVFETMRLNAGTHTWEEGLRMQEERTAFYGRTVVITVQGTGRPKLKSLDHYKIT